MRDQLVAVRVLDRRRQVAVGKDAIQIHQFDLPGRARPVELIPEFLHPLPGFGTLVPSLDGDRGACLSHHDAC